MKNADTQKACTRVRLWSKQKCHCAGILRSGVDSERITGDSEAFGPEVGLWEVCRPDLVTSVTRRSRKPLGRVVGISSLWPRPDEFFTSTGWALSVQVVAPMKNP